MSTMSTSGDACSRLIASRPGFGRDGHHVVPLQHAGQREDVADVVVDDQHLLAGQHDGPSRIAVANDLLPLLGHGFVDGQAESDGSPRRASASRLSTSRRLNSFARCTSCWRVLVRLPDSTYSNRSAERSAPDAIAAARPASPSVMSAGSGASTTQSMWPGRQRVDARRRPFRPPDHVHVEVQHTAFRLRFAGAPSASTTSNRRAAASTNCADARQKLFEHIRRLESACAGRRGRPSPSRAPARRPSRRRKTGNMPHRRGRCFSRSSTRQPSMSGSEMSSRMAWRLKVAGQRDRRDARGGDQRLEAHLAGESPRRTPRTPDRCRRSARRDRPG